MYLLEYLSLLSFISDEAEALSFFFITNLLEVVNKM